MPSCKKSLALSVQAMMLEISAAKSKRQNPHVIGVSASDDSSSDDSATLVSFRNRSEALDEIVVSSQSSDCEIMSVLEEPALACQKQSCVNDALLAGTSDHPSSSSTTERPAHLLADTFQLWFTHVMLRVSRNVLCTLIVIARQRCRSDRLSILIEFLFFF